jgi:hypothetical protein
MSGIFQSSIFGAPTRLEPTTHRRRVRRVKNHCFDEWGRKKSRVAKATSGFCSPHKCADIGQVHLMLIWGWLGRTLVIITNGQPSADIKWSFLKVRTGATRSQTILKCRLPSSLDYRTRHGSQLDVAFFEKKSKFFENLFFRNFSKNWVRKKLLLFLKKLQFFRNFSKNWVRKILLLFLKI